VKSNPGEEKEGCCGKDLQKKKVFKCGIKQRRGDGILIITTSINVSSITTVKNL